MGRDEGHEGPGTALVGAPKPDSDIRKQQNTPDYSFLVNLNNNKFLVDYCPHLISAKISAIVRHRNCQYQV